MYIIEQELKSNTVKAFAALYNAAIEEKDVTINITKPDHEGDFTVVVFPLVKHSKLNPVQTANALGEYLQQNLDIISKYNAVQGFLNLTFTDVFWIKQLQAISEQESFGQFEPNGKKVLLEYCGPNTNKPLHIGHVRNMLLGFSMSEILSANGYEVIKVNIYNDRGITICKSMAAYLLRGNNSTPESTGIKGDHFVGDYYVMFGQLVVEELHAKYNVPGDVNVFKAIGIEREVAEQQTEAFALAKSLLLKWEAGEEETVNLWKKMNGWV